MLLTGFQGYGGRSDNPSAEIARLLDGASIGGDTVVSRTLPVTNCDLRSNIIAMIDELRPKLVICLGLAPGEQMIRIERIAANHSNFEIPDNAGDIYRGPVIEGAPAAYDCRLPVYDMRDALVASGIPAYVSCTAGAFLCNAVTFHSLHHCAKHFPDTRSGFIHLPYMPSQVADLIAASNQSRSIELYQRADLSSMALEVMLEGVRLAIECALQAQPD